MKKAASVRLRAEITEFDTKLLLEWLSDKDTTKFLSDGTNSVCDLMHLINNVPPHLWRMCLNGNGLFYMIDKKDKPIGFIRLTEIDDTSYEVIIAIGEKSVWGQGYGTIALQKCLSVAFFEQRAKRIIANIYPENIRSVRLFEKMKFKKHKHSAKVIKYALTLNEYIS